MGRQLQATIAPPTRIPQAPRIVDVLGVPLAELSPSAAIAWAEAVVRGTSSHHLVLANAHTLNLAAGDPAYREILRGASLVLRDGVGVEIATLMLGHRLEFSFAGTDFVPSLLARIAKPRLRVFLFGGEPGVAAAAAVSLRRLSPAIDVVATEDGFGDSDAVVRRVQSSGADVLLVALGNPLQEQWIAAHLPDLNVHLAIGVGALLDFLSHRAKRAPRWIRRLRCEWLYRLSREPRRLWRRYLLGGPQFLWRVARVAWAGR